MSSLSRRYHVIGLHKAVRSTTQACVTCRRITVRPQPQMLGQLLIERVMPDSMFDQVGVDYAGPVYVKYGYTRKPTVIKSYICLFVSLSVKAVQLELVSDLSTDAFIASLRRFTARRGKPTLIWSDHGDQISCDTNPFSRAIDYILYSPRSARQCPGAHAQLEIM